MNAPPPRRRPATHPDLFHWARATRTEVEDLLEALEGRATVDAEKVVAARGHFGEGFRLVGQALGTTPPGP